jgi:alpha-L-fucosidase 2
MKTLPPSWTGGSITDIRCRGGHQASVTWRQGRLVSATILAAGDREIVVELPDGAVVITDPSGPVSVRPVPGAARGRHRLAWNGKSATRYAISPR